MFSFIKYTKHRLATSFFFLFMSCRYLWYIVYMYVKAKIYVLCKNAINHRNICVLNMQKKKMKNSFINHESIYDEQPPPPPAPQQHRQCFLYCVWLCVVGIVQAKQTVNNILPAAYNFKMFYQHQCTGEGFIYFAIYGI